MMFESSRIEKKPIRIRPSSFPASKGPISCTFLKYRRRRYSTPKMTAQNRTPKSASNVQRALRPRSPAVARARAVRNFGRSRWSSDGFGSGFSPALGDAGSCASSVEDIDELPCGVLPRELEEDFLEPARSRLRTVAKLVHRAARAD